MSQEFITTGRVEGGVFRVRNRRELEVWARRQRNGEYTVTVERAHATRSLEQNSLYFAGYVKPIADHCGEPPRVMHEYLKARFLPPHKRKIKTLLLHDRHGVIVDEYEIDLSTTTTLNKVEFSEYLEAIAVFAAELGVTVGPKREAA